MSAKVSIRPALAALGVAVVAFAAGRLTAPRADAPGKSTACPEVQGLDPALASLSDADLERRYRDGYLLPPSSFDKQLVLLRGAADAYVPERRACMMKVSLVHAIVGQEQAMRSTPSMFGLTRSSEELRRLFLTTALERPYTDDERLDVIAQVEDNIVANLAAKGSPEDAEHWRRRYYGLLLVCGASDESLARLGASRPGDCLRLEPRAPKHDAPAASPSASASASAAARPKPRPRPRAAEHRAWDYE